MPLASASGKFANSPMRMQHTPAAAAVHATAESLRHAGVGEDLRVDEQDVRHRQKRRDGAAQLAPTVLPRAVRSK